jgi:hypothetical protein
LFLVGFAGVLLLAMVFFAADWPRHVATGAWAGAVLLAHRLVKAWEGRRKPERKLERP